MNKQKFEQYFRESFGKWQDLPDNTPYYELVYSQEFRDDINVFVDYFHKSNLFHISSDFYWDIVPEMDINAVCFKLGNHENIGLCYGLMGLVYHYYGVLFCSDTFLPNLKSSSEDIEELAFFHKLDDKELELHFNSMHLLRHQFVTKDHKMPIDSVRFRYMNEYGLYSCLFVFLHEISHLVRGHLDQQSQQQEMINLSYNHKSNFTSIESIYLELDADKFASYMYIKFFLETYDEFNLAPKTHFYHKWLPILLYFILVDIRTENKQSLSHPKPAYRYALIKKHIFNFFGTKKELFQQLEKAVTEVENTIEIFFKQYKITEFNFFSDLNQKNEIKKLETGYTQVTPIINKQYKDRKFDFQAK